MNQLKQNAQKIVLTGRIGLREGIHTAVECGNLIQTLPLTSASSSWKKCPRTTLKNGIGNAALTSCTKFALTPGEADDVTNLFICSFFVINLNEATHHKKY